MIAKELLRSMIPHAGAMCLLDAVEDWTAERIRCTACTHRSPEHPLLLQHKLSALHLIEYAAQAIAVHGALLAQGAVAGRAAAAQPGFLGAVRDVKLHADRIDTLRSALNVLAERRMVRADGMVYDFEVEGDDRLLCEGRAVIVLGQTK